MIVNIFNINTAKAQIDDLDIKRWEKEIENYIFKEKKDYISRGKKEELKLEIEEYMRNFLGIHEEYMIETLIKNLIDKIFGYGKLQKYIEQDKITDIRVVSKDSIYYKEKGIWKKSQETFTSDKELEEYIRYCILKNNGNINFETPMVVVSDKNFHLRIEAGIYPINPIHSSIIIRIHRNREKKTLETLFLLEDMLDVNSYDVLQESINKKKNIIIAGKGGSGKTTLLNALLNQYPDEIAMTINEETTELYLENKNCIQREIQDKRREGKEITLENLTKESLVMSNDAIIIGEIKGGECSFFLDAIHSGHIGLATVHSNSAISTIPRLITLFKREKNCANYQEKFIEELLCEGIEQIVYMKDYKVEEIVEVAYDTVNTSPRYKIVYQGDANGI